MSSLVCASCGTNNQPFFSFQGSALCLNCYTVANQVFHGSIRTKTYTGRITSFRSNVTQGTTYDSWKTYCQPLIPQILHTLAEKYGNIPVDLHYGHSDGDRIILWLVEWSDDSVTKHHVEIPLPEVTSTPLGSLRELVEEKVLFKAHELYGPDFEDEED